LTLTREPVAQPFEGASDSFPLRSAGVIASFDAVELPSKPIDNPPTDRLVSEGVDLGEQGPVVVGESSPELSLERLILVA
jgi:hypothetical protein